MDAIGISMSCKWNSPLLNFSFGWHHHHAPPGCCLCPDNNRHHHASCTFIITCYSNSPLQWSFSITTQQAASKPNNPTHQTHRSPSQHVAMSRSSPRLIHTIPPSTHTSTSRPRPRSHARTSPTPPPRTTVHRLQSPRTPVSCPSADGEYTIPDIHSSQTTPTNERWPMPAISTLAPLPCETVYARHSHPT
jgi:hypothetical protein